MSIIEFVAVNYQYNIENYALQNVSLNINKGEFVSIIGHNGSGKSTLAKHINALFIPTAGTVKVLELITSDEKNIMEIRHHAGMVFQNPDNQMVTSIIEEDVAFGPENLGIESKEIRARVDDALKSVNMMEFAKGSPEKLSGGQKQRIAIAGILAMKPDIIVLDEPTAMLDPRGRREVIETVKYLNKKEGITVVLITHFMDEAEQCDRVIVMNQGVTAMEGSPEEIFKRADELHAMGLDVPYHVKLCNNLIKRGVNLQITATEEEMVEELCQLLSKI